jgi:FtsH-binding integral membrane protein
MADEHRIIPVWFFVGVILLIYGVLILVTGIAEFRSPPPTVLAELHAPIWWGAILTLIGGLYVYLFRPKKPSRTPPT